MKLAAREVVLRRSVGRQTLPPFVTETPRILGPRNAAGTTLSMSLRPVPCLVVSGFKGHISGLGG